MKAIRIRLPVNPILERVEREAGQPSIAAVLYWTLGIGLTFFLCATMILIRLFNVHFPSYGLRVLTQVMMGGGWAWLVLTPLVGTGLTFVTLRAEADSGTLAMLQVTAISPDEMERGFVLASMYRLRVLLGSAAALSVAGVGGTVAHALIRQYGLYLISSYVPSPLKPAPHHAFLYTFPLVLLAVAFLSKTVVGIILMVRAYLLSGGEAKALAGVWVLVTFLTLAGLAILIRVALEPAIGVPYYDVLPARLGPMSITAGYGIMIISGTAGLWAVKLA